MPKTYGQFCGLARALDHVGDRWTLLVIRELLLGDVSYGELLAALAGIPTNLLADRLRELEADGLVTRHAGHLDRRRVNYRLTPLGRGLEPVLLDLIRWGAHWMRAGPSDDRFDPRWLTLALQALLNGRRPARRGTIEVMVAGGHCSIVSTGGAALRVGAGISGGEAQASVEGDAGLLLGVASGEITLAAATRRGLHVRGDKALARAVLQP